MVHHFSKSYPSSKKCSGFSSHGAAPSTHGCARTSWPRMDRLISSISPEVCSNRGRWPGNRNPERSVFRMGGLSSSASVSRTSTSSM